MWGVSALRAPAGDSLAVYTASARFLALAGEVERLRSRFGSHAAAMAVSIDGPRGMDVAEAAGAMNHRLAAVGEQFALVSAVLRDYATVLTAAQEAVAALARRYQREWEQANALTAPGGLVAPSPGLLDSIVWQAEQAHAECRQAALRAAAAIEDAASVRVPCAGAQEPRRILAQALGAWSDIVPRSTPYAILTAAAGEYPTLDAVRTLSLDSPRHVAAARHLLFSQRQAHAASELLRQTKSLESAKLNAVLRVAGDVDDYRVLRQFFATEEIVSRATKGVAEARLASAAASAGFVDSVKWTTKFAKVTGVTGIYFGLNDLRAPKHEGWRGVGDRVAGGGAVAAGGLAILITAGVLTAPAWATAAAVVGGGAAAWSIGNAAVDHWDDITHGASVAVGWVGDAASAASDWAVEGVGSAAGWVGDKAGDVGRGVAESAAESVEWVWDKSNEMSRTWHQIKGMFD